MNEKLKQTIAVKEANRSTIIDQIVESFEFIEREASMGCFDELNRTLDLCMILHKLNTQINTLRQVLNE